MALAGCSAVNFHEDAGKRLESANPPDLPGATQEYKQAVEADKTNTTIRLELANCCLKNNDAKTAVEAAKVASSLEPRNAQAHLVLAKAFAAESAQNEALQEYNDAFMCDSTLIDACLSAGKIFEDKGDNKSAADKYRAAIKSEPNSVAAHEALAQVLSKLGDMANAESEIKEATRLKKLPPKPQS
jgi:Tfp pilus assembly protein PilF